MSGESHQTTNDYYIAIKRLVPRAQLHWLWLQIFPLVSWTGIWNGGRVSKFKTPQLPSSRSCVKLRNKPTENEFGNGKSDTKRYVRKLAEWVTWKISISILKTSCDANWKVLKTIYLVIRILIYFSCCRSKNRLFPISSCVITELYLHWSLLVQNFSHITVRWGW